MKIINQLVKSILVFLILLIVIAGLSGCSGNPKENFIKSVKDGNYAKAVKIYNSDIFETNDQAEVDSILEQEIDALVEKWDTEKLEVEVVVRSLDELSGLKNTSLSNLAKENNDMVRVEGVGRLLHVQAEKYYDEDKLAEAMNCVLEIDSAYSQYDNAKELYDTSEKILLETVSTPYSSKDCKEFVKQLAGYLNIVDSKALSNRKAELENLVDEYINAEEIVNDAAKLYDVGKYKKCFEKLSSGIKKYPDNNLLNLAYENSHSLYVIEVTQSVLKLCEKKEYKEALAEIETAKAIYDCSEFSELEDSVRKQKSLIYRIATSVVDKFKAFTQDGDGETLPVKEIGSKSGAYVVKSGEKILLGDYSDEEVTALSFSGDVLASLAGVDLMMDLRDVSYDLVHWGEGEYFLVHLAADTVALLPVIGVIKYFDFKSVEKTVDAMKQVGNISEASKNAGKVADVAGSIIDTNKTYNNIGEAIKYTKEKQITKFSTIKNKYVRYVTKPTINQRYNGKVHPAGVKFSEKKLKYSNGNREIRVVPEFDFSYEIKLEKNLYMSSREDHFKYCNDQLQKAIKKDATLRSQFTAEQIKEIENGIKTGAPSGYTWHHNEREGVLQLVDAKTHQEVAHTGGFSMWGAGSLNAVA